MNAVMLLFGAAFGFFLSYSKITDYDTMIRMFRFEDLHVMWVMMGGMAVAAPGLYLLRRSQARALMGCEISVHPKPYSKWVIPAGLLFGTGWALTGA